MQAMERRVLLRPPGSFIQNLCRGQKSPPNKRRLNIGQKSENCPIRIRFVASCRARRGALGGPSCNVMERGQRQEVNREREREGHEGDLIGTFFFFLSPQTGYVAFLPPTPPRGPSNTYHPMPPMPQAFTNFSARSPSPPSPPLIFDQILTDNFLGKTHLPTNFRPSKFNCNPLFTFKNGHKSRLARTPFFGTSSAP